MTGLGGTVEVLVTLVDSATPRTLVAVDVPRRYVDDAGVLDEHVARRIVEAITAALPSGVQ